MTPDTAFIRETLLAKRFLQLDARQYDIEDLELPAGCTLQGVGQGLTVLNVVGGETGILVNRDSPSPATTIRSLTVTTDAFREQGIWVKAPALFAGNRGHAAELTIEHVEVLSGGGMHPFRRGVVIENIADARVYDVRVRGIFDDITGEGLNDENTTTIGFDLTGSQEAKLIACYVHGARIGVYSNTPPHPGSGEGHAIVLSALINVQIGARLDGRPAGQFGGFKTPWLTVALNHIFYLNAAVLPVNYHDVHVLDNSLCVSHFAHPQLTKIGVYPVLCANGHLSGNTFWDTAPGNSLGIQSHGSSGFSADGNLFDPSTTRTIALVIGSEHWTGRNMGNTDAAGQSRTIDQGLHNDVI